MPRSAPRSASAFCSRAVCSPAPPRARSVSAPDSSSGRLIRQLIGGAGAGMALPSPRIGSELNAIWRQAHGTDQAGDRTEVAAPTPPHREGPLSIAEEHRLSRRWRTLEDKDALARLVQAHLGLVIRIATEFRHSGPVDGGPDPGGQPRAHHRRAALRSQPRHPARHLRDLLDPRLYAGARGALARSGAHRHHPLAAQDLLRPGARAAQARARGRDRRRRGAGATCWAWRRTTSSR